MDMDIKNKEIKGLKELESKIKIKKEMNPYYSRVYIPVDLLKNKIKFNVLSYGMENPYQITKSENKS